MTNKLSLFLLTLAIALTRGNGAGGQATDPARQQVDQSAEKDHGSRQNAGAVSWDSSRLREVDRNLTSMGFSKVDARDRQEQEQNALLDILNKRFSRDELHNLAASFASLPVDPEHWRDFERKLVWATIESFLRSGDRDGLVLVLSLRCPRWIASLNSEDFLVQFRKKFKDPITVLGEAYAKCTIPETRRAIADAARRAFTGSGVEGKDDRQFIENAMRWYDANKGHLEVNWHYGERSTTHNGHDYDTNPLFVPRADEHGKK